MKQAEKNIKVGKAVKTADGAASGKAAKTADRVATGKGKKAARAVTAAGRAGAGKTAKTIRKKPGKNHRRYRFILGLLRNENRIFHGIAAVMQILINRK